MAHDEFHDPNSVRLKLEIAYDGTHYAGWQTQKDALGVQEVIENAFEKLFPSRLNLHGSSRTDAGVHALGMVAHVEIPKAEFKMEPRRLPLALNSHLPEDIRLMKATRAKNSFHARFDATGKQYRYQVWNHAAHNPLLKNRAWTVHPKLDVERMREAAAKLIGKRSFRSFATSHDYEMTSYVRTLHRCRVKKSGPLFTFVIEGDGFLYQMCRGIVGTLVHVGLGKIKPSQIRGIMAEENRTLAGANAPACGLVLWKVFYAPTQRK
jgi:tRNA pseudouridine38-40 synthase